MDTNTVTDTAATMLDAVELDDTSFVQETGKTLATIAVTTTLMLAGSYVASKTYKKFIEFRVNREMAKIVEDVHTVTDLPAAETETH